MRESRRKREGKCYQGHEMTPENTYIRPDGNAVCRQCSRLHWRHYYRRRKAQSVKDRQ